MANSRAALLPEFGIRAAVLGAIITFVDNQIVRDKSWEIDTSPAADDKYVSSFTRAGSAPPRIQLSADGND